MVLSPKGTASRISCGSLSVPYTSGPLVIELATFLTAIFLIEQEVADARIRARSVSPSRGRAPERGERREGRRNTGEARYPPRSAAVKACRDRVPRARK